MAPIFRQRVITNKSRGGEEDLRLVQGQCLLLETALFPLPVTDAAPLQGIDWAVKPKALLTREEGAVQDETVDFLVLSGREFLREIRLAPFYEPVGRVMSVGWLKKPRTWMVAVEICWLP